RRQADHVEGHAPKQLTARARRRRCQAGIGQLRENKDVDRILGPRPITYGRQISGRRHFPGPVIPFVRRELTGACRRTGDDEHSKQAKRYARVHADESVGGTNVILAAKSANRKVFRKNVALRFAKKGASRVEKWRGG